MNKSVHPKAPKLRLGQTHIRLIERLCNACAVSGDEHAVRQIVLEHIRPLADKVWVDALGNLLAVRQGTGRQRARVMLAAHMDEVGFMLTHDDNNGFFRFENVGGINPAYLLGKSVWIGREQIPGVIGAKPIHLSKDNETQRKISLDDLRIDVGPENKNRVKVGERATFATKFSRSGESIRAKALDDRLGVAALIEIFKDPPEQIDLLAAFTVQEEVGLRGARVAAYALDPHMAFVIDSTLAADLPAWDTTNNFGEMERTDNAAYNTRLGAGPAIYVADHATLSDPRLVSLLIQTAEQHNIPYQIRQPGGGGTDAGAIHKQRAGIPSVSLSTPARYIHSPAGIARLEDWKHLVQLLQATLHSLDANSLSRER